MGNNDDKTHRRQYHASDECYRMLVESSQDLIFVLDRDLNHEYVNSAAAATHGLEVSDIIGRNWLEFFPEDRFPLQVKYIRQVFATCEPVNVEFEVEIQHIGKTAWLSTSLTPVEDDDGSVIAVMVVARDISQLKETERAFAEREKLYRALAETAQDFIYVVDPEGTLQYVNEHGARMFGTHPSVIEGKKLGELFPAETVERQLQNIRAVIKEDKPLYTENYFAMPMGEEWMGTTLSPMKDDEGNVTAVVGISRIITATKKSESDLVREKEFSEKVINSMPGIFYLFDESGRYIRWNDTFEYITGYTAEEMEEAHPLDFFEGYDRELITQRMNDVFKNGRAEAEADLISKDGTKRRYYFTGYRMESGDDVYLVGVGTDVSELRRTETMLAEREERLRLALEGTGDSIWDWDITGGVITYDDHWCRHLGYEIGERVFDLPWWEEQIDPESKPAFKKALNDYLEGRRPAYEVEYRMKKKDGEWIWVWAIGKCVEWDGDKKPLRIIGTHRDITARKDLESLLAMQRDRAQTYLEIAPAIIVALDREGKVSLMNDRGCKILGCEETAVLGLDWFDHYIPEEHRQEVKEVFAKSMAGENALVEYYENPVVRRDGSQRMIAWHNTLIRDDEGNITGTLSSGEDVTDRRQAEMMLRDSEQRFKTLFDVGVSGILLADVKTRRFALGNDTICEMLGCTHEELTRMGVDDIHPKDDLPRMRDEFEKQARGEKHVARGLPVLRKDGSVFYADISTSLVSLSGVDYLMGYFTDATDRHLAEAALKESERKFRELFEDSNDVIFISTPEGELLDINTAGVRLFGYGSRDELLNVDIGKEFFVEDDASSGFREAIEQEGEVNGYELRLRNKDGSELTVSVTAKAVKDESGRAVEYRGIIRDITEQRQLQSQLMQAQKMESIGNLAGGVAHDFNNYLTAIQGYADLALLENPEEGPLHDYLNEIRSSSGRAADLTRQLLLFGRREEVDLVAVDLAGTITDLQKMLNRLIGERFTIVTRIAGNLESVMADKGLMEQMIVNLVVNARDSMPDGGEIAIEAVNVEMHDEQVLKATGMNEGSYIRLKVIDSGHGMDAETLKHIFEPFFTTKEVGKGTGLGLSVVYGIITQHQGMVDVESEVGGGTTFTIYLPVAAEREEIYASSLPGDVHAGGGARLLIVEDDDAVRNLAVRMLAEKGYDVSPAASCAEARELFSEHDADFGIVFSDVILPDGNGLELVEELKRKNDELGVVLASGYTGEDVDRQKIQERGHTFIQKPYTLAQMVETIGQLMKR